MAFFELLKQKWEDIGSLFKPIAGRGTGGYYPSPGCHAEGADNYGTNPIQCDSGGHLMTRGPVFTDEESFRNDFSGSSLNVSLTGTLYFTNGSDVVTGVGTSFKTELDREYYVKLNAHGETAWAKVMDVVSDTEIELEIDYIGATGNGASSKTLFPTVTGAGGSFSVSNSILTISSGTTLSSKSYVWRDGDYGPMMLYVSMSLSQRIANQEFYFGFVDNPANGNIRAVVVFDGTDNTKIKLKTSSGAASADVETTTVSLPNGVVTSSAQTYELTVTQTRVFLTVDGVKTAEHRLHIPGPYDELYQTAGWNNTGTPASSTNALLDAWFLQNQDRVEVAQSFVGDKIPVRIEEDIHVLFGTLTTTTANQDQVICSYVVPSGKYLFVVGYNISGADTNARGVPVKVGKGNMTETASPGVVDGLVLRSMLLNTRAVFSEAFAVPRYLAASGETVKITITPDSVTNSLWRASLDFVLR